MIPSAAPTPHRAARTTTASSARSEHLEADVERACARIAPTWPLDRFIAVNPLWPLVDAPLPEVAARLRSLSGAQLLMPRAWYRDAYLEGSLRDHHLRAAIAESGATESLGTLRALLEEDEPELVTRARVVDVIDADRDLVREPSWRSFVVHSISQLCAAHFDDGQATFRPSSDGGLYASFRRHAPRDRSPSLLMGARAFRAHAAELPESATDLIARALTDLAVDEDERADYLWSLLLDVNGWASWCAYQRWTARLRGDDDGTLTELLAVRLAWEWLLHRMGGDAFARRWARAKASWPKIDAAASTARSRDWLLQAAMEIAWREPVVRAMPDGFDVPRPADADVQAVFCIDVRSEVYRRALEATAPSVQTLGFAGFFGLPLEYRPCAAPAARPQLPGLLAPRLRAEDTGQGLDAPSRRAQHLDLAASWRSFKSDPVSTFTFVEALGPTYALDLVRESFALASATSADRAGLSHDAVASLRPRLVATASGEPLDVDARCDLAASILRGMSLTRGFAPLVALVGHGSATRNNPHAAGLDCGACCGQTGEVNARAAAALLNDPAVRAGLAPRGIAVPDGTWFVAALHNTTDDSVALFEVEDAPASHRPRIDVLRTRLAEASARARAERAASLGLEGASSAELERAVRRRTRDWAEVRAEWGLANNAAFLVAPRERCKHLDLRGRSFLHEYRHEEDEGYAVLEQIMTAPMIVTHWINFQYYASTVDNLRYGSGNKVLHNVVGGHLGVFEGNGGDLRIGLPLQSLHDGARWVHTPLRLSVFIDAPRDAIDAIVRKHEKVRELVEHGWILLFRIDAPARAIEALRSGRWHRVEGAEGDGAATEP